MFFSIKIDEIHGACYSTYFFAVQKKMLTMAANVSTIGFLRR